MTNTTILPVGACLAPSGAINREIPYQQLKRSLIPHFASLRGDRWRDERALFFGFLAQAACADDDNIVQEIKDVTPSWTLWG